MTIFNVTINEKVEMGLVIPINGSNIFIEKKTIIKNAMLRPAEKSNDFIVPRLWHFKILRITKPGTKVRKINPITCLIMGTSMLNALRATKPDSDNCKDKTRIINLLTGQSFIFRGL